MKLTRVISAVFCCIGLCACGSLADRRPDATSGTATVEDGKILVMLRLLPSHFRPDVTYGDGYGASFGGTARRQMAAELATRYGLKLVTSWPMPALQVDCFVMTVPAGNSAAEIARRIALDPRVDSVQEMQQFDPLANDPLYPLQPAAAQWHLAEIHRFATGRDIRIAEVDTGVELDHPDLRGQIELSRNFVDDKPYAPEGHGTAVAGIIAARADDGIGIAGVAPGARLLALRACWERGSSSRTASCNTFTLAKALQFALDHNVRVINLSLGGPHDALLARLLDVALSRGIAVVAAFDNRRADGGFPASYPGVFAVTADEGSATPANALIAPGHAVPAPTPTHAWGFVSGSSYAAAHITGMIALLLDLAPDRTVGELREALAPAQIASIAHKHGYHVDACATIARATGAHACSDAIR